MRTLILGLIMLAVSVVLTLAVKQDNGYVLLGYGNWTVEGSLAFFVIVNLLLFAVFYLAIRFVLRLWAVPGRVSHWNQRRGTRKAQKALTQGLVELSEGNWKGAEKDLVRFAGKSETPLLNYLAAARSAQQQGANERRDHYLQLAHESMPSADVAVSLTQAELQLANEQYEQALATLKHLRSIAPKHTHVLKLLKELYERLGEWQALYDLLPELKKRKVINETEQRSLELNIFRSMLNQAAQDENPQTLVTRWRNMPVPVRSNEAMVTVYANHLLNRKQYDQVESLLRDAITRQWSDDLVELYGRVAAQDSAKQLAIAEGWLKDHARAPVLLLTLGRLSIRSRLWGKARSYLEASIGIEPSVDAYRELGALLERMDEGQKALDCFKEGLNLSSDAPLTELPASLSIGSPKLEGPEENVEAPTDINPPKQARATQ
ncbi:MAG: heme biosynthesis protein HemY [Chromatiales bacterium]|nr:heme biosynthesis protein HemY [Chromatiales bacterium]